MSSPAMRAQLAAKRTIDVLWAGALLILLSPVLLAIGAAVRITSPGGALFRQERIGRAGQPFVIYKFRTMTVDAGQSSLGTYAYRDDPRITQLGKVLRRLSLDELPQLFNILKGEMSRVGPRPDLPHHVAAYTLFQRRRLEVRPGVTGWAQVSGRNAITWEERIALDVEYIDRWSLLVDLDVVVRTVGVVVSGRGSVLPKRVGERK